MVRKLLVLVLVITSFGAIAQDDIWGTDNDTITDVLLLPLNPDFYISDCDHKLAKAKALDAHTFPRRFREALDFNIQSQLMGVCNVIPMLTEESEDIQKDITAMYGGLTYSYQTPTPLLKEKEKVNIKNIRDKLKAKVEATLTKDKGDVTEGQITTEYVDRSKNDQYMHAKVIRQAMIDYYVNKFDFDLLLTINQIDLKTVALEQQDMWAGNYTRQVWVHFDLYDTQGNVVWGDVVKVNFNSNRDDIDMIIRNTLPDAATYIANIIK